MSWAIGRQGFIRGKANGWRMIELVCALYEVEVEPAADLVANLLSHPEQLARPMAHWPLAMRQEFSFALALVPPFDTYVIEGSLPFEPCRFTRLWSALFEECLVGRSLILSTYRHQQMADYCRKALVYDGGRLLIRDDLDACLQQFPPRRSRSESTGLGDEIAIDSLMGAPFSV